MEGKGRVGGVISSFVVLCSGRRKGKEPFFLCHC